MAVFATLVASAFGIASTSFAATAGAFVLKTIVGFAANTIISKVTSALIGGPKKPGFSIQTTLRIGGDVPRSIMLGRGATAGSLVYGSEWGKAGKTPNAYLTQVIALSDYPVASLERVFVNGEPVTLGSTPDSEGKGFPVDQFENPDGEPFLWVKFYDGTQTSTDDFLKDSVSNDDKPYDGSRVGFGVAYAIVTARIRQELFTGVPSFRFEIQGARLYDITRDSTAGGSGAHRWDDPDTWGGDGDNLPAVQAYNLLRGLSYGGQWLYGLQNVTAAQLPSAHWRAEIAKCRALIREAGGMVPTYTSGGEIALDAEASTALEAILTACNGRFSAVGGAYKVFVGTPGASVAAFLDEDIISTAEQTFSPFFGLAETINGISATFPSPAQAWNKKAAPTLLDATLEAEDGGRRLLADVEFDLVSREEQVQRLMVLALREARRARRHTITLPPQFWVLEPGDVVTWTSIRNGYVAKTFRVDGVLDLANCDVTVDLTEVDPSDFDWDTDTDYEAVPDGPLVPRRPFPQAIEGFGVTAAIIRDGLNRQRRPAIRLAWTADDDVDAIQYQVRLASSGAIIGSGRTEDELAGAAIISAGILPATAYQVRGRLVPRSSRVTVWSSWLSVTTADIRLNEDDIQDGLLTIAKFAAGIEPVGLVSSLPNPTGYTGPKVVLRTTDTKLYRYTGTGWVAGVLSGDILGQLQAGQFAADSVTAGVVAAAAIGTTELAANSIRTFHLGADQVTADKINVSSLSAISANLGSILVQNANIANLAVDRLKIGNGEVITDKIGLSAVTSSSSARTGNDVTLNTGYSEVLSAGITTAGNFPLLIFIEVDVQKGVENPQVVLRVRINNNVLESEIPINTNYTFMSNSFFGTNVYRLDLRKLNNGTGLDATFKNGSMIVLELKR